MLLRIGKKMSRVGISGDLVNHLFNFPESFEKFMFPSQEHESNENKGVSSIPVDILDTPKEYIFYMDVPGMSKSDIQVCLSFPPSYIANVLFYNIVCLNGVVGFRSLWNLMKRRYKVEIVCSDSCTSILI